MASSQFSRRSLSARLATTCSTHVCSRAWPNEGAADHPAAIHFPHDMIRHKRSEGGTAKETVPR
jgi:hypothetical protein